MHRRPAGNAVASVQPDQGIRSNSLAAGISSASARITIADDVVGRIAQDLSADTGSARGFSRRNLFYMRRFATIWPAQEKVPSVMAQIVWTSHRVLMDRFGEDPGLYSWYAAKTVANRWSVRQLHAQIQLRLHERQ
jgi:hypothetical protein